MILVPNHRQRLSGNNILLLLFVGLLFGCNLTKKTVDKPKSADEEELEEIIGSRKYNTETGEFEYQTVYREKMDTVSWNAPSNPATPIEYPENTQVLEHATSEQKDRYKLVLMIPFMSQMVNTSAKQFNNKYEPPVQFYAGVKMALKERSYGATAFEVEVMDTRLSEHHTRQIIVREAFSNVDVVLAPWRSNNLKIVDQQSKNEDFLCVSPIFPSSNIATENPNHIQINPSTETHARATMAYVKRAYPDENIVLIDRNASNIEPFQLAHFEIEGSKDVDSIKQIIVDESDPKFNELDLSEHLIPGEITVFVVPVSRRSAENFAQQILRLIDVAKNMTNEKVVVFGMENWQNFKKINYDRFESLNLHLTSSSYIDRNRADVREFARSFFAEYGAFPQEEAYKGYDIANFLTEQLERNGTKFQYKLDQTEYNGLHTSYRFEPIYNSEDPAQETYDYIDRFENKFVHVLKFEEFQYKKVR